MPVSRTNVDFAKRILADRVGNDYVYGGNWNPFNVRVGTDCSGLVIDICDAVRNGTGMAWTRHGMSTESWRPIEVGQTGTIFNTVCVASPADFPADAAVKIAIHHGPGGGANSHMWCEVDGVRGESNGSHGCVTGSQARSAYDTSYANDWHYLPGPITTGNVVDPVQILVRATGLSYARAQGLLPLISDGLRLAQCTSPRRIAMWLAQVGHESAGFNATEEYQSGDESTDRWKYKGRTWIQITWLSNYSQFGAWCNQKGLLTDPNYFVANPKALADMKWAALGPAWYITVARPTINSLADQGDVVAVTKLINGGTNGLAERQNRYNMAMAVGDGLLALLSEDDDMFTDEDRNLLNQVAGIFRPSLSPFRHVGEGNVNTCAGFAWSADGLTHPQFVVMAAKYGHLDSIRLLAEVAANTDPARADDAAFALAVFADLENNYKPAMQAYIDTRINNVQ